MFDGQYFGGLEEAADRVCEQHGIGQKFEIIRGGRKEKAGKEDSWIVGWEVKPDSNVVELVIDRSK